MNIFTILLIVIKNQHDLTGFDTVKTAFADLCKPILVQEVIESIIKGVHWNWLFCHLRVCSCC